MNGPVPIGWLLPCGSSSMDGAGITPIWPVSEAGKATHGELITNTTVRSSGVSMLCSGASAGLVSADALWAFITFTTAAAVSGVPSLNWMPGRSLTVQRV